MIALALALTAPESRAADLIRDFLGRPLTLDACRARLAEGGLGLGQRPDRPRY